MINSAGPAFYDCRFEGNTRILEDTEHARGGAIEIANSYGGTTTRIIRCIFKDNVAQSEEAAYGGEIYSSHAPVDIVNSFFYNNSTRSAVNNNNGYNSQGGAIYLESPTTYNQSEQEWQGAVAKIINCTIVNNHSLSDQSSSYTIGAGIRMHSYSRNEKFYSFNNCLPLGW